MEEEKSPNIFIELVKENKTYLIILLILLAAFIVVKNYFSVYVVEIDEAVMDFFQNRLILDSNTAFMKYITFFGSVYIYIVILVLSMIFIKNKDIPIVLILNVMWVFVVNSVYKFTILRERPIEKLIEQGGYSFPSAHAMCSMAFYGLLCFFMVRQEKRALRKWLYIFFFSMLVIFISISRIYLNVHYFSDVVCGLLTGLICLLMFINITKKYVLGENK